MSVCGTLFRCTGRLGHLNRAGGSPCPGGSFFSTGRAGCANCVSVFALTGRLLFLHRKAGVHELRQRVRP